MKKRPVIGMTASEYKSRIAWFFDWLAVWRVGGQPRKITPGSSCKAEELDGLIIGGGDDINAELYGGEITLDVRTDPKRDQLELDLLRDFLPLNRPVLGICRGAQIINIFFGGSLFSDVFTVNPNAKKMRTVLPRKRVYIEKDSRLRNIIGVSWCQVNALHHQAVDRLGEGLHVAAQDSSGMIQAIESTRSPMLIGVQWHPEFLVFNRPQQRLLKQVVTEASSHSVRDVR